MAEQKRARTKTGQFIGDDPNTPQNEAWVTVGGVEASGNTDPEPEEKGYTPPTWKYWAGLFVILLVLALLGITI